MRSEASTISFIHLQCLMFKAVNCQIGQTFQQSFCTLQQSSTNLSNKLWRRYRITSLLTFLTHILKEHVILSCYPAFDKLHWYRSPMIRKVNTVSSQWFKWHDCLLQVFNFTKYSSMNSGNYLTKYSVDLLLIAMIIYICVYIWNFNT